MGMGMAEAAAARTSVTPKTSMEFFILTVMRL